MNTEDNEPSNFNKQQLEEIKKITEKLKDIYSELMILHDAYDEKTIKELAIILYINGIGIDKFKLENYGDENNGIYLDEIVEHLIIKIKLQHNLIRIKSYSYLQSNIASKPNISNNKDNIIPYHMIPKKRIRTK